MCKASAGAVEHLRVARVRNLADFLAEARGAGCWCYGASARAPGERAGPYDGPDYAGRRRARARREGAGLRPRVAQAATQLIALPLRGRIGSLNVNAAAGGAAVRDLAESRAGA